ncbi:Fe-S cluster assembly ATPase SufC [Chitinivorax tropicus]|uniref:Fe-S cluster assembly ATPase SufC n=1 Tax=Chitinivorax tropicus TaxID=714531 RepID=A0A840MD02_9PROT|nr:DUF1840 domain-containing protein [Chitinivorax tropicus]MBB5017184.1 Fe-S cluster assembly ATPase SufC [Chitinivorax tropicus]
MLYKFKSTRCGEVLMLGQHAQPLLNLLGKNGEDRQGIFTVEQLPKAISTLKTAMHTDKGQSATQADDAEEQNEAQEEIRQMAVSLHQRAFPLLDLLERSLAEDAPVTWGA